MGSSGEAGDDQGWFEVKKKHRNSSRFSLQSNIQGFFNKAAGTFQQSQSSALKKVTNGNSSQKYVPPKGASDRTSQAKVETETLISVSKVDDQALNYPEKEVINQESVSLQVPISESVPDVVSKIKWGDLEDDALDRSKSGNNSLSFPPSFKAPQDEKMVKMSEDLHQLPDGIAASAVQEETPMKIVKGVNEIASGKLQLSSGDKTVESSKDGAMEPFQTSGSYEMFSSNEMKIPCTDEPSAEIGISQATFCSELGGTNQVPSVDVCPPESVPLAVDNTEAEISGTDSLPVVIEDSRSSHDGLGNMNVSTTQATTASAEDGSGESKERFRERLWCFLFENLNRAVDELYLLCELECDVEQMEEAILVLEEAGSDFKELKSRVEEFDKVRRSSFQFPKDATVVNLKTDHRRPHALSWEVRRMTTSPRRAEILSSSLEAFKKIQQERASIHTIQENGSPGPASSSTKYGNAQRRSPGRNDVVINSRESGAKGRKPSGITEFGPRSSTSDKRSMESSRLNKIHAGQSSRLSLQNPSGSDSSNFHPSSKDLPSSKKDKASAESKVDKFVRVAGSKRLGADKVKEKEKEKENKSIISLKSMDAWKEKRNWEDVLASPLRYSMRVSHSPGMNRRSAERARVLHDKLMSPEKKKKTALDLKREAEEKHARAMRIRSELENERVQRLQRTSEKLTRVSEWQAVRSLKLREGMFARHQRSESRHEAHIAQVVKRAGDESSKVNEVRFITSLNEENKKLMLRQKLQESEFRRAEKLQVIKIKQKEDSAREEAVLERRKLLEAEKLQRLAETQRKKEEAQVRREEERKASSAAREARHMEQLRRKEVRAKAQQEEAELLAQKLAERLAESEMRRKCYLEQIREKASMDFRDQSSPSTRRGFSKEGPGKNVSANGTEDLQISGAGGSVVSVGDAGVQQSWKRRTKKIRQRLMALKHDFAEPPVIAEIAGIGYKTQIGSAKAKIARWIQDLQKLRQARKEGATSIGLIIGDTIKFLEGKELELHASRQAGLVDFIASALPASHTSKPEACQVTLYLLRLLKVVLALPANRSYCLAQNLLPPVIPMLSAALENYIKISATSNLPLNNSNFTYSKGSPENLESIAEVLEGFLWTVTTIIGHAAADERQNQIQEGLLELVVAYQVIHHLRDLFALFDRPQLEGVPFPSSILLSLNFLVVLTSRSGFISSINWESYPFLSTLTTIEVDEPVEATESEVTVDSVQKTSNIDKLGTSKYEKPLSSQKDISTEPSEPSNIVNISVEISSLPTVNSTNALSQRDEKSKSHSISGDQMGDAQQLGDVIPAKRTPIEQDISLKQPIAFLLSAITETGLIGLPSLLTAVLLQANSRPSTEQGSCLLPSNFEEVATGVLKVLNNLALLDINLLQRMLARPDLRMEFFHLMSFLLSHCTSKWKAPTDQVGFLLFESLLLLGYFSLFHPGNQAVLRWGKSPTILHKVCDLPFVFFTDPELMPILAGTLVAACYGCDQNRDVVQQELSMDMLLSLFKTCRLGLAANSYEQSAPDKNTSSDDHGDVCQPTPEPRKLQGDHSARSNRTNLRGGRGSTSKGGNSGRLGKFKSQKDSKGMKACDEWASKHNLLASMLHNRFPSGFLNRVEAFFSSGATNL